MGFLFFIQAVLAEKSHVQFWPLSSRWSCQAAHLGLHPAAGCSHPHLALQLGRSLLPPRWSPFPPASGNASPGTLSTAGSGGVWCRRLDRPGMWESGFKKGRYLHTGLVVGFRSLSLVLKWNRNEGRLQAPSLFSPHPNHTYSWLFYSFQPKPFLLIAGCGFIIMQWSEMRIQRKIQPLHIFLIFLLP